MFIAVIVIIIIVCSCVHVYIHYGVNGEVKGQLLGVGLQGSNPGGQVCAASFSICFIQASSSSRNKVSKSVKAEGSVHCNVGFAVIALGTILTHNRSQKQVNVGHKLCTLSYSAHLAKNGATRPGFFKLGYRD